VRLYHYIAHETAGAARIRLSLRPLNGEGVMLMANLGRILPRDREAVFVNKLCLRTPRCLETGSGPLRRERGDHDSLTRYCDSRFAALFPPAGSKKSSHRNPDSLWSHPVHAGFVRHARQQHIEAAMDAEFDYDLTRDQWEALKAFRQPATERRAVNRLVADSLIALQLAAMTGDGPVITPKGRSVLLRGSPQLWDVAA
jgi:hypothetical protein